MKFLALVLKYLKTARNLLGGTFHLVELHNNEIQIITMWL